VSARARWFALLGLACAAAAHAQDFAGAGPMAGDAGAFVQLERALPPQKPELSLATSQTRWWRLAELETRAAALAASWRTLRAALGVSQTGAPDVGWTAVGIALGGACADAGAGLRAVARADRTAPFAPVRLASQDAGLELGGGAWLKPAPAVRVWASAPQLYVDGAAPPLARSLELGVRAGGDTGVWVTLAAPRAGDDGERALGVVLAMPPVSVWAEVRDAPLRGAAGLAAGLGHLIVQVRTDAHPVLGETLRLGLTWRRGGASAP